MEKDREPVVALGLGLGSGKVVDMGILVGLVRVDQDCLSLSLGLGLAWALLVGKVVLSLVFLRGLGVLWFHFLLSLRDVVGCVMDSDLPCLIRILRCLGLGFEVEVALVLVVGVPSSLEEKAWA